MGVRRRQAGLAGLIKSPIRACGADRADGELGMESARGTVVLGNLDTLGNTVGIRTWWGVL